MKISMSPCAGKVEMSALYAASSFFGMVVKIDVAEDLRRYCSPHRDTKRWKELYSERTSVERCNSRMKDHQYLNAIVLLASALAVVNNRKRLLLKKAKTKNSAGLPTLKVSTSSSKLRHTFATRFHKKNNDVVKLQAAMRHRSVETSMIYTHVTNEELKEAVNRIND